MLRGPGLLLLIMLLTARAFHGMVAFEGKIFACCGKDASALSAHSLHSTSCARRRKFQDSLKRRKGWSKALTAS